MAYDLGDLVPLTVTIRDADGDPTNATTVTLTITLPDSTIVTPSVTNPPATTGIYLYDYPTVQAGRHTVRWTSTGPQAAYAAVVDVRPATPAYIVSLADVKQQLNMESDEDDEELRAYLEGTTYALEDFLGRAVVRRTFTDEHSVCGEMMLNWTPVQSITSVATVDGLTTWAPADLHVSTTGVVTAKAGVNALVGNVLVTYVAGPAVIPANWTLGARFMVQHLWETQRGTAGAPQAGGMDLPGAGFTGYGYAIPPHVKQMLSGRLPGV